MTSKMNWIFPAILLLLCPAFASADETGKNAKIEEMMQMTHVDQMMSQMLDQMKTMAAAQMQKADLPPEARAHAEAMQQKMNALIADRLSWDKSKPLFIKIYSETFTESEVDGILAFYKSSAGRAMIEKMPLLMQKSMGVGQQLLGDVMPEIKRMAEESGQPDAKP